MVGPQGRNGTVLPSPVVLLSVLAVVLAAVAFVVTRGAGPAEREIATTVRQESTPTADASPSEPAPEPEREKEKRVVQRAKVFVEVYNNAGITGLADSVGGQATAVGWQVVGTDNWYGGNIPTSTVYYPERLQRPAKQLALDLGIERLAPAVGAMRLDRLTLILTAPL
jgi:hypothetical protein